MLSKSKIDRKLKKYIRGHLSKGYSKHAVKKVLVEHGYNEPYVDGLLRKHAELQFVKKYAVVVLSLFVISIFSFNLIPIPEQTQKISGYAVNEKYLVLDAGYIKDLVIFNGIAVSLLTLAVIVFIVLFFFIRKRAIQRQIKDTLRKEGYTEKMDKV